MRDKEFVSFDWERHNHKVVSLDGYKHQLEVSSWTAIYPYEREVLSVMARPVSKRTDYYLCTKRALGDDWAIDVLSDPATELAIFWQLV